jgi:hypothetical protein
MWSLPVQVVRGSYRSTSPIGSLAQAYTILLQGCRRSKLGVRNKTQWVSVATVDSLGQLHTPSSLAQQARNSHMATAAPSNSRTTGTVTPPHVAPSSWWCGSPPRATTRLAALCGVQTVAAHHTLTSCRAPGRGAASELRHASSGHLGGPWTGRAWLVAGSQMHLALLLQTPAGHVRALHQH